MLQELQNHIKTNLSFLEGKKLLLAVSGGIDSMVLLDIFQQLHYNIVVAHCNFQLRGDDSAGDQEFVRRRGLQLLVPVYYKKFETTAYAEENKVSIQQAARKLRYDWFYEILNLEKAEYIITAHHLDDSLETFLINFSRGTGIDGLTGIPFLNHKVVRPLLNFSRADIEKYAKEKDVEWREDASNASNKYLRNGLRHNVIPKLKELQPQLLKNFKKTRDYLKQTQQFIFDVTQKEFYEVVTKDSGKLKIDIKKLLQLHNYQGYLYFWLSKYEFSAWNDVYSLVYAQLGKQVFAPNYTLLKDRDFLILYENGTYEKGVFEVEKYTVKKSDKEIVKPMKMTFTEVDFIPKTNKNTIVIDEDKLVYPLVIRKFCEGDYFYPFGMRGKKKLSKYFKDEKISLIEKSYIWLLCSKNEIVWIINHRMDDRYKVTDKTKSIIEITCHS
jgi:tRNA(Ile)-lysidine synthase